MDDQTPPSNDNGNQQPTNSGDGTQPYSYGTDAYNAQPNEPTQQIPTTPPGDPFNQAPQYYGSPTPPPPPYGQVPGYQQSNPYGQQNYSGQTQVQAKPRSGNGSLYAVLGVAAATLMVFVLGAGVLIGTLVGNSMRQDSNNASPYTGGQNGSSQPQMPSLGPATGPNGGTTSATTATPEQEVGLVYINTKLGYQDAQAAGTGMILSSDGLILTNHHVVEGASQIEVQVISTGKTYTASVLGYDATHDVAVLKMQGASGLDTVKLDSSNSLNIGDAVTAVGNANGDGGDASAAPGTVTGLNESINVTGDDGSNQRLTGLIQMDADVIAGDSGGAVYDAKGKVVGMTTAASSGAPSVTGYAVPINTAKKIADDIVAGHATGDIHLGASPFLGVQLSTQSSAAVVIGVIDGTPAASLGIENGSTITAIDDTQVSTAQELSEAIGSHKPGEEITVTWTDPSGASQSAKATLMKGPVG